MNNIDLLLMKLTTCTERLETYIQHFEKLQEEDFMKKVECDEILQPIIINFQDSDSEDSENFRSDQDNIMTDTKNTEPMD